MEFGWYLEICADKRGVTGVVTLLQDSVNGGVRFWSRFIIIHSNVPNQNTRKMELEISFVIKPGLELTWCSDGEQFSEGSQTKEEVILQKKGSFYISELLLVL